MRVALFPFFILLFCLSFSVPAAQPLRVLVTHRAQEGKLPEFKALWAALPDTSVTLALLPQQAGMLKPGLEKQFDAIVMYEIDKNGLNAEQQKNFIALLNTGIGIVSLHHHIAANRNWPEFRKIVGGKYFFAPDTVDGKLYPKSTATYNLKMQIKVADKDHPITRGLKDFEITDEAYGGFYFLPGIHVLLTTDNPKSSPNVAWTNHYGKSAVFYLMFGHDAQAWNNENFRTLLARGLRWVAEQSGH